MSAAKVFAAMQSGVNADVVKKVDATYRFDVKDASGVKSWFVDLKNGSGSISDCTGKEVDAECTIAMSDADFVDLMTGKLDGQSAFMGGQLKIKGDMMLAMKLEELSAAVPKDLKL